MYRQFLVTKIFSDKDIDMEKKLNLIHRESEKYDGFVDNNTNRVIKMQESQTKNVGNVSNWWRENWWWVISALMGAGAVAFFRTTEGRKILSSIAKQLPA